MARAKVNQLVQVGVESTKGIAVAANKQLPSMDLRLTRNLNVAKFRAMGYKLPTAKQITQDFGVLTLNESPINFTELAYLLSTIVTPVITTPGGATLARKWLFTVLASGTDDFKTLTVQQGDSAAARQMAYSILTDLSISLGNDGVTMSGSGFGRAPVAGSLTGSPTAISQLPGSPRGTDIFMDAIGGTIGTTKIVKAMAAAFNISAKQALQWVLNTTYGSSFAETVEQPPDLTSTFTMEDDAQSRALYDSIVATANPVKLMRYLITGPLIEGSTYYTLKVDFPASVEAMEDTDVDGNVAGYSYTMSPEYNSVFGNKAFEIELITTLTAL
ncbi:MAG: hypothetical protein AABN95_16110 [Acidobacteriota bacterium]